MKISKITLDNVRCFEHLEIDLKSEDAVADWTVILGNNGVGKTTILRSIALGITEQSGASGLIDELDGDWIREGQKKATIKINLEPFPNSKDEVYILTTFKETEIEEIEVEQKVFPPKPKIFKWKDLFLCGYGAARRQYGSRAYAEYTVTDAVYTLFNYNHELQNPELNIRRAKSIGIKEEDIFRLLENILMLDENSITLDVTGLRVSGPWGSKMPMGALGDGYQATMAWILDLFGWNILYDRKADFGGIVLLDEIEQHLHPKWQREIINDLRRAFPNVQFIVTSHSPLVASNSYSRNDNINSKLFVLEWKKDNVEISEVQEPIDELGYEQLLGSEAFGHMYNYNKDIDEILKKMSEIASIDKPTQKQKALLETIKKELKKIMFPKGRYLIEREVEREYYKELEDKADYLKRLLKKK